MIKITIYTTHLCDTRFDCFCKLTVPCLAYSPQPTNTIMLYWFKVNTITIKYIPNSYLIGKLNLKTKSKCPKIQLTRRFSKCVRMPKYTNRCSLYIPLPYNDNINNCKHNLQLLNIIEQKKVSSIQTCCSQTMVCIICTQSC